MKTRTKYELMEEINRLDRLVIKQMIAIAIESILIVWLVLL